MSEIGREVRALASRFVPVAWPDEVPGQDLPLGEGGLGLDSVALLELLLACEERFGLRPSLDLLARGPLTLGSLVAHVSEALRPPAP